VPNIAPVRIAVAALVALLLLGPATASARSTHATRQRALESQLARQINAVRRAHGLRPLGVSSGLSSAAAEHTREMGADGYFAHESYDSTPFWKRIARWYPSRGRTWSVGENLLYDSGDLTAQSGVRLWMNSPPHRENLLSKTWREIGISAIHFNAAPGEYRGGPVTIVTADFGARR
jgi:uncharacterized protein YkwD